MKDRLKGLVKSVNALKCCLGRTVPVMTSKSFHSELSKVGDPCHSKLATGINALLVQALIHLSSVSSWVSISVFVLCISTRREHRGRSRSNEPLPAFCIVGDVYVLSHTVDNSMVQNIQNMLSYFSCSVVTVIY